VGVQLLPGGRGRDHRHRHHRQRRQEIAA
jgi:hypothetical protein